MLTITTGRVQDMARLREAGFDPLDVSVKSGDKSFCPTWAMVMEFKHGVIPWETYTLTYGLMMEFSRGRNRARWDEVVRSFDGGVLILTCYCPPPPVKCHRHLLAVMLADHARTLGIEARVIPEVA